MSVLLSLIAPLAALTGAADAANDTAPVADGFSRRFAEIHVTSGVCALFGYGVDFRGLAAVGETAREQLTLAGLAPQDAAAQVMRDVRIEQGRFQRTYGDLFSETAVWPTAQFNSSIQHATFHQIFEDRCTALAASEDAGQFLTPPEQRLSRLAVDRNIRAVMRE